MKKITTGLLLAGWMMIAASGAQAQLCFGPDGLSGPCCTATSVNLPAFPAITLRGLGLHWTDCAPSQNDVQVAIGAPSPDRCGGFDAPIEMRHPVTGAVTLAGLARLDYVRTWTEIDADGRELQVWRFLIKVELGPGGGSPPGSDLVPSCIAAVPVAFYAGHIDYARHCQSQGFAAAISLFHGCDRLAHLPGVSALPGAFHPRESWAIVGPNNPSNPFVPNALPPMSGKVRGGALRTAAGPGAACQTEDPLQSGDVLTLIQGCLCSPAALPAQYAAQKLNVAGSCPSSSGGVSTVDSIVTPLPMPWFHMITISLGEWTGAGPGTSFPGPEKLWSHEVFTFHRDACAERAFLDMSYGVSTDGGFQVVADEQRPWLTPRQLDLASNYSRAQGIQPPFVGLVLPTRHLVSLSFD